MVSRTRRLASGSSATAATFCVAELHCWPTPGCCIAALPSSATPIFASAEVLFSAIAASPSGRAAAGPSAAEGSTRLPRLTLPITRASGELAAFTVASTDQSCASTNSKLGTGGKGGGSASSWPSRLTRQAM